MGCFRKLSLNCVQLMAFRIFFWVLWRRKNSHNGVEPIEWLFWALALCNLRVMHPIWEVDTSIRRSPIRSFNKTHPPLGCNRLDHKTWVLHQNNGIMSGIQGEPLLVFSCCTWGLSLRLAIYTFSTDVSYDFDISSALKSHKCETWLTFGSLKMWQKIGNIFDWEWWFPIT